MSSSTKNVMMLRNYTDKVMMIFGYSENPLSGATLSSDKAEYTQTESGSVLLTLKVNYSTNYNDTATLTTALKAVDSYDFISNSTVNTSINTSVTDENGNIPWFKPADVTAEFSTDKPDNKIHVLSVSVIVNYAAMTSSNRLATQLYLTVEDTTSSETKNPTVVKVIDTNSTTGTVDINIAEYSVSGDQSHNLKVEMDELIMTVEDTDERFNQPVIVYYDGTDKPDKNKLVEYGILDMEGKKVSYTPDGVGEFKNALMNETISDYVATDGMMTITYETVTDEIVIKANANSGANDLKFEAVASARDADKLLITSNPLYEVSSDIVFSGDQIPSGSNYTEYTIDGSVRINVFFTGSDEDGAIARFNAFDVTKCSNISQDGLQLLVVNNFADTLADAPGSQWVIKNTANGTILEGTISADGTVLQVKREDGHPVAHLSTLSSVNKYRKCEVEGYIMAKDHTKIVALVPQIVKEPSNDLTTTLNGLFGNDRNDKLKTNVVGAGADAADDKIATFGTGVVFGGSDEQAEASIASDNDVITTTVDFTNTQQRSETDNTLTVTGDLTTVKLLTANGDIVEEDSQVIVQTSNADLFTADFTFNQHLHGDGNNNAPSTYIVKVKIIKVGSDYKVVFIKSDESDGASIVLPSGNLNEALRNAIANGPVTVDFNKLIYYTDSNASANLNELDVNLHFIHENNANTDASAVLLKNTGNGYAIGINNFNNLKSTTYQTFKEFIQNSGYLTGTDNDGSFETPLLTSNEPLNTSSASAVITEYNYGGANYNSSTKGVVIKAKLVKGSAKIIKVGSTYDFTTDDMVVYIFVDFIDAVKDIAADINTLMLDNTFIVNTSDVPTVASHSLTITKDEYSLTVLNVAGTKDLTTVRDTILKTSDRYTVELDEHCGDNSALSEQFNKHYYPYGSELVATLYKTVDNGGNTVKTSLLKVSGSNQVSDAEYNVTNAALKLEAASTFTHLTNNADMKHVLSLESAKVVSISEFVTILMGDTGNLVNGFNTAANARYDAEFAYYVQSILSSVPAQMAATKTMTDDMLTLSTSNNTNIGELKGDINALGVTPDGLNIVAERARANTAIEITTALVAAIEQDANAVTGDIVGNVPVLDINNLKATSNTLDDMLFNVLYNYANGTAQSPAGNPDTGVTIDPHTNNAPSPAEGGSGPAPVGNLWRSIYEVQKEIISMATTLETDIDNLYERIKDEVLKINKAIRYTNQMSYYADVALMRLLIRLRTIQETPAAP